MSYLSHLFAVFILFTCLFLIAYKLILRKKVFKIEKPLEVFDSTILKHSEYSEDLKIARKLKTFYFETLEGKRSLKDFANSSGLDFSIQEQKIDKVLSDIVAATKDYRGTLAYEQHQNTARLAMSNAESEVKKILETLDFNIPDFNDLKRIQEHYDESFAIHKNNLRKCDIIRPHNHKAVPLKNVSTNLIDILKTMSTKGDCWSIRHEIRDQLEELSEVIEKTVDELETFDSKSYVENELKVSRNLLIELKNAQYVDVLKIDKEKVRV